MKQIAWVKSIDKNLWDLVFVGGRWRFLDADNRLLSFGWIDEEDIDIEKVKLTHDNICIMLECYHDYLD